MQAANEPAYHAVKLDVCLTASEIVAPFSQFSATLEPVLVRPEEEVSNRRAVLSLHVRLAREIVFHVSFQDPSTNCNMYRSRKVLAVGYGTIFAG